MKLASGIRASTRTPLLQVLKTSAAAIVAWLLCVVLLAQPLPIFAAIAALLVVQPSLSQSLTRGIERSVGVIAGVVVAYGVGLAFGKSSVIVLGAIVVSLLLAWAFRLSPGSANQIPISAMLVLAIGAQTPSYAVNRILETVIGAIVGLVVNATVVPPVLSAPAHRAVQKLLGECAAMLDSLSAALVGKEDRAALDALLVRARTLRPLRETAAAAVAAGKESLTLNPRGGRARRVLARNAELLDLLTVLTTRLLGMSRAVRDHYDPELSGDPTARAIARELERAAHDLRLLGRDVEGTNERPRDDEPTLTAPLSVLRPPAQWVLIGSLLEDIRRVREEITGTGRN